jgi:arsenate reductase
MFSNTFAGIAPSSVPSFVIAQILGGAAAILTIKVLYPHITPEEAAEVPGSALRSGRARRIPAER